MILDMVTFLNKKIFGKEKIIAYTSKHWNHAQQKYSTVKREVIVLSISKFQSDLVNQNFLFVLIVSQQKIFYKRKLEI